MDFFFFFLERLNIDGILVISVPYGYSLEEMLRRFTTHTDIGNWLKRVLKNLLPKEELIQTEAESPHLHFFTLRKFKSMLRRTNFEILEIKNSAFFFKETFYLFLRLFLKRGSRMFRALDRLDNRSAELMPICLGDGWIIVAKHKYRKTESDKTKH
jgi:hypothetical protein